MSKVNEYSNYLSNSLKLAQEQLELETILKNLKTGVKLILKSG